MGEMTSHKVNGASSPENEIDQMFETVVNMKENLHLTKSIIEYGTQPAKMPVSSSQASYGESFSALPPVMQNFLIGSVSTCISKAMYSPLERATLLMQTQDSSSRVISGTEQRYTSYANLLKRVHSEQGVAAFWRGYVPNCMRASLVCLVLPLNDAVKQSLPRYNHKTHFWQSFGISILSGGLAGGVSNFIFYPLDFARVRLASDVGKSEKTFNSTRDCIMKTVRNSGITGLYRGCSLSISHAFVHRALQLGVFSQVLALNPYKYDKGRNGMLAAYGCAKVGTFASLTFSYPLLTVFRRVMLESEKAPVDRIYKSPLDCARKVWQSEGVRGMYKGIAPEFAVPFALVVYTVGRT